VLFEPQSPVKGAREESLLEALWQLEATYADFAEFVTPEAVRGLMESDATRLETILKRCVDALSEICMKDGAWNGLSASEQNKMQTALRLLTRVLPFVLERASEPFIERIIWKIPEGKEWSLGRELLQCIGLLLFLPGFTLPAHAPKKEALGKQSEEDEILSGVQKEILWEPGIMTGGKPAWIIHRGLNKNREEVLKLLLVCQSEIVYTAPEDCKPETNQWTKLTTLSGVDCGLPFGRELFCSLINTMCSFNQEYWLPSALTEDVRYVDLCIHNLLALLEVNSEDNCFRTMVSELSNRNDFAFIYDNVVRLLWDRPNEGKSMIPWMREPLESHQELLVLMWKLLDSNEDFMNYVLEDGDVTHMIRPICFFLWHSRKDISQVGLIHICTFLLLLLSGERGFGIGLNEPYLQDLYLHDAPKMLNCNHGDLLIIVLHKLIVDGMPRLLSLHNCFYTIMCNISPYMKKLSKLSAFRLMHLLETGDNKKQLLELFKNIIQYQYEGNPNLVYAMCVGKDKFLKLEDTDAAIVRMLEILVPQVEGVSAQGGNEDKVIEFLRKSTMVGLLPVPHPIVIRRYQPNDFTTLWFTTYTWGIIFLRNQEIPVWDGSKIKLFGINVRK